MAKIRREEIVSTALALLDEVGLDALTTRTLARRLGVESPTLYWHFRDKAALMAAMASEVLVRHPFVPTPVDPGEWESWFAATIRGFHRALLAYRDGARLHAGTVPDPGFAPQLLEKIDYMMRVGLSEQDANLAFLTAGQFALASALETQSRHEESRDVYEESRPEPGSIEERMARLMPAIDDGTSFEFGLSVFMDGLRRRIAPG